ncbi:hypothetical protein [Celerinatantimonas sp. YJH-8]|uniref:hypothetical protein n=1 Tax=Celerinatantimonas sp. YJH-8 TaxID=3228714 RepID=UPI0038CA02E8
MGYSAWHARTQAGDQCLQQDQPGMALIHYLAAIEQARYWMEQINDNTDDEYRIETITLFLRSCMNLSRYWYIQSDLQEQQRYLLEACQYQDYLHETTDIHESALKGALLTYYKSLCHIIAHHPESETLAPLRTQANQLEQSLGLTSAF